MGGSPLRSASAYLSGSPNEHRKSSFRVITRSLAVDQSHVFYCGEAAEFARPGDLDVLAMADSAISALRARSFAMANS
jgi:hypothetical protein